MSDERIGLFAVARLHFLLDLLQHLAFDILAGDLSGDDCPARSGFAPDLRIAMAGGVLFIGATKDEKFRAFDTSDGSLLWQTDLPAGGYATPCTYSVEGRQYIVIACGGAGKPRTKSGDQFVAFALR